MSAGKLFQAAALFAALACGPLADWDGKPLKVSRHAAERSTERGVGCAALKKALATCQPFRYNHERRLKTGCFDKKEKVFVALEGGTILTVIADPGTEYVERLKRRR